VIGGSRRAIGSRRTAASRSAAVVWMLLPMIGCSAPARPDAASWRQEWARVRALVPSADPSERDGQRQACEALLVAARQSRTSLLPTPNPDLDEPIQEWIERAESLGFTCPAATGHLDESRAAIASLHVLEAEIEAVLQSPTPR